MPKLLDFINQVNDKMFNAILDWRKNTETGDFYFVTKRGGIIKEDSISISDYEVVTYDKAKDSCYKESFNTFEKASEKFYDLIFANSLYSTNYKKDYRELESILPLLYVKSIIVTDTNKKALFDYVKGVLSDEDKIVLDGSYSLLETIAFTTKYEEGLKILRKLVEKYRKVNQKEIAEKVLLLLDYLQ